MDAPLKGDTGCLGLCHLRLELLKPFGNVCQLSIEISHISHNSYGDLSSESSGISQLNNFLAQYFQCGKRGGNRFGQPLHSLGQCDCSRFLVRHCVFRRDDRLGHLAYTTGNGMAGVQPRLGGIQLLRDLIQDGKQRLDFFPGVRSRVHQSLCHPGNPTDPLAAFLQQLIHKCEFGIHEVEGLVGSPE